jgi:hypothetical protein
VASLKALGVATVLVMSVRIRRALVGFLAVVTVLAIVAPSAFSSSSRLTGTWSGYMRPVSGATGHRHGLRIVVNASERGGSWRTGARCGGPLRLKDISDGFHHYVEELARGSTCLGGGIDCLERAGPYVYDEFQSHPGTYYDSDGTLSRVAR